jgi:hypothetical protein
MGFVFPFEKLEVWQLSVDLAEYVLDLLETIPSQRPMRIIGQMESSAISISQFSKKRGPWR